MNELQSFLRSDAVIPWFWAAVAIIYICRVVIHWLSRTARYTWWDDDPRHPTGQNNTDRAINSCTDRLVTLGFWLAGLIAIWETLEALTN